MFRVGHVVHTVDDLAATVEDYRALGFSVEWGSAPRRAHNALIWFAAGPFIEIISVPRWVGAAHPLLRAARGAAVADRFRHWACAPDGIADVAVESPVHDLPADRDALVAAGVPMSRVLSGRRVRPDGQTVRYQFVVPGAERLPFLVSAYTPPQRPHGIRHENGARRISRTEVDAAPGDLAAFRTVTAVHADLIEVRPGTATAVRGVHIEGLAVGPDAPRRWRGGVYRPA